MALDDCHILLFSLNSVELGLGQKLKLDELIHDVSALLSFQSDFVVEHHLDEPDLVLQSAQFFQQLSQLPGFPLDVELLSQVEPSLHDVIGRFVLVDLLLVVEQDQVGGSD